MLVRSSLADRSSTVVDRVFRPLFTVGDAYQLSVITLGEATADITIDGAYAAEHPILVVSDDSIPVDVLVGRTWLNLPHISYYKRQDEFIIESLMLSVRHLHQNVWQKRRQTCTWHLSTPKNRF